MQNLAAQIGEHCQSGTVILLQGHLGSGKTTFTQGLGQGLGISALISSPTFTLLQEYWEGRLPLFHADLYRLSPGATADLGLEELWEGPGVVVIEWSDRLLELPEAWLGLELAWVDDQCRSIQASWQGDYHHHLWQQAYRQVTGK